MWHLHGGKPERCLSGWESEDEARREAARTGAVVCDSIISHEECAGKMDQREKQRVEEARF